MLRGEEEEEGVGEGVGANGTWSSGGRESEVEVQSVLEVRTGNDTVEGEDVDKRGGFIKADVRGVCCGKGEGAGID